MTFIPTPFTTNTKLYCVVATQGKNKTRKDISGPLSIFDAQARALDLKGDSYHKRPAAVPYPYKSKSLTNTKK